ncbi:MAG: hypothetical protein H6R40_92 [Gemmatimonadetes bacterium]|nr:hypothetical protein [Gemmatimonadota bacterium]
MSTTRNRLITIALITGFVGLLIWSTIKAQSVECRVCVNFNGRENCAVASGATAEEAASTAQTTACGPVTGGMNDAIACGRIAPSSQTCQAK